MPRRSSIRAFNTMVVAIAVAIPLLSAGNLDDLPPPIQIRVVQRTLGSPEAAGAVHYLPRDITLGQVLRKFHLQATSGDFLDVEGKVIEPDKYEGRVLLNGAEAPGSTALSDGDEITAVDAKDRTERTVTTVTRVPPRVPANPQFYLGTAPGRQIVVRGKVSGKLVSARFVQTTPTFVPPAVALTFDDGPHPIYTPKILRILEKFHVPATFFVVGTWASAYPELVQAELDAGMVVGNHSWNHPEIPPFRDQPRKRMRQEMVRVNRLLLPLGAPPYLFRPPGGTYSPRVLRMAKKLGMRVVLWSIDPEDWRVSIRARAIADAVISSADPGDIIILHDGGGSQDATVKALPMIIKGIRKLGLTFSTIERH